MTAARRVVWSQGMFLQPHHFQQEARHVEQWIDRRARAAHAHAWGWSELTIDEAALALGRIGLARAAGVLPDGAPFAMPEDDPLPPPFDVPADLKDELVVLAAPRARGGVTEVDFGEVDLGEGGSGGGGGAAGDPSADRPSGRPAGPGSTFRFRVVDEEVRDHTHAVDDPEPIQTAALNLVLLRARDAVDAWAVLGTVRVLERRADGQVVLDRDYVPPQTRIEASRQLSGHATLLHGLVRQRARRLAGQMGQLSHGVSEMADFLMLQALNRAEPVLRQHAGGPHAHPETFHADCLRLAGDLSTFSDEDRLVPEFPLYRHDALGATFAPVVEVLRRLLSALHERNALQLELVERSHGVRTSVFADPTLARSAGFVLAVNAQMPSQTLRQRFPSQSKLGPVDRLRDLVNLALPGVEMRLLPTAPRQLPFHAGFHYFELDRGGELWGQIERSGSLALFTGGEFPGLELELWAIRQ